MTPERRLTNLAETLTLEAYSLEEESTQALMDGCTVNTASALFAVAIELKAQASTLREIARLI